MSIVERKRPSSNLAPSPRHSEALSTGGVWTKPSSSMLALSAVQSRSSMRPAMVCVVAVLMDGQRPGRRRREVAKSRSPPRYRQPAMPQITSSVASNGLPVHRVALPGTRATTVLVAFDAGARTERPDENGMAHFLEHLVFKGGEKYPTYRDVNETAERLGAQLNAYTSHDLVAFHITCRSESAMPAIDLLTDFVGRAHIDAEELDRERGVVVQEIARANDVPSTVADHLIDRASYGDHPLGRSVLGPAEHLRSFPREAIVAFRERQWAPERGGAFVAGDLSNVDAEGLAGSFGRFPAVGGGDGAERAPEFERRVM